MRVCVGLQKVLTEARQEMMSALSSGEVPPLLASVKRDDGPMVVHRKGRDFASLLTLR